jgi:hypothetical protein
MHSVMRRIVLLIGLVTIVFGLVWAVRVWTAVRVTARSQQFNDDIVSLFDALQKYKENVGTYPTGSNAEIARSLKGRNSKSIIVVVGRKTEVNEKGEFVDPWRTPLRFYFSDTGILIRSAGPNRRFDDSTAIDGDDLFRSN